MYVYSQAAGPAFRKLLDAMARATTGLDLAWMRKKREVNPGRLDKRFLSGHIRPSLMSHFLLVACFVVNYLFKRE